MLRLPSTNRRDRKLELFVCNGVFSAIYPNALVQFWGPGLLPGISCAKIQDWMEEEFYVGCV